MLPPKNRLAKVRDFNLLMKEGRFFRGGLLDLKVLDLAKNKDYIPKKEDPETFVSQLRIAFTVGLKVSKKAVLRNRAKRQLREVVRLLLKQGVLATGYYVLVIAKPGILAKEYAEISQEMTLLLKKSGVLR